MEISKEQMALVLFNTAKLRMRDILQYLDKTHKNGDGSFYFFDNKKIIIFSYAFSYNFMATTLSKQYPPSIIRQIIDLAYDYFEKSSTFIISSKELLEIKKEFDEPLLNDISSSNVLIDLSKNFISLTALSADSQSKTIALNDCDMISNISITLTSWITHNQFLLTEYYITDSHKATNNNCISTFQLAETLAKTTTLCTNDFYRYWEEKSRNFMDGYESLDPEKVVRYSFQFQYEFIKCNLTKVLPPYAHKKLNMLLHTHIEKKLFNILHSTKVAKLSHFNHTKSKDFSKVVLNFIKGTRICLPIDSYGIEEYGAFLTDISIELFSWERFFYFLIKDYQFYKII